ncbi:unnamed protein product [Clonostachys solani]|uniref:aldehyde dehydrogenase (NAD(+)) n=1 Tax=Clonostachys solani TaxID=160281 RepID=A0A9N9ZNC2_9HYPO|nr:unnamed protein product [Clonostachys solani]
MAVKAKLDLTGAYVQIIDGKASPTEATRNGINPANLQALPKVPVATSDDLDRAVLAGKRAFKSWSKVPLEERRKALHAYADAIENVKDEFRDLLVAEGGKPLDPAAGEITFAIQWIRGIIDIPVEEETIIEENEERSIVQRLTPIGVVGAIVPWNFPAMLLTAKLAPALLTGNVIIIKPSPFTPYCGLKLVELAQQFFPPGVVQSLSGGDELGPWITSHPGIDKISFTGSTNTGKLVHSSASKTLKRVTLELGGNDPAIVLPDVDIDATAKEVAFYAFLNTGQICLNIKRIYVHESIFDEFRDAVVKHVKTYVVGDGADPKTTHGPLQNAMQYERVKTFFSDIKNEGWNVAVGGEVQPSKGYFIPPTLIDRPPENSRLVVEEPFGPIVPILSWKTEEEVIERANDTNVGLGGSVWSKDVEKAERLGRELQVGTVWVNTHFALAPISPFGGHKESGIGIEWGLSGIKGFTNSQTVWRSKKLP